MVACIECAEVTAILHIQSSLAELKAAALVSECSCVGQAKLNFAAVSALKRKVEFPHLSETLIHYFK